MVLLNIKIDTRNVFSDSVHLKFKLLEEIFWNLSCIRLSRVVCETIMYCNQLKMWNKRIFCERYCNFLNFFPWMIRLILKNFSIFQSKTISIGFWSNWYRFGEIDLWWIFLGICYFMLFKNHWKSVDIFCWTSSKFYSIYCGYINQLSKWIMLKQSISTANT